MAKSSYDKYYEDIYASGKGSVSAQDTALKNAAKKEKDLINKTIDDELNLLTEDYNTSVADVNEQYEDAFKRNATQKALNERYLERKAAEMGLTDSGLNRTQMTANQLSYANQNASLDESRIKDLNTLSAALKARKIEKEQERSNKLTSVDNSLESNKAQLWSDYESSVRSTAESLSEKEYKDAEKAATDLNNLVGILSKSDDDTDSNYLSRTAKETYIKTYINQYGMSPALTTVLDKFGYRTDRLISNAYNEYLKNYASKSNISKAEKIQQFLNVFEVYGPPPSSFFRTLEFGASPWWGKNYGITVDDLYKAIEEA